MGMNKKDYFKSLDEGLKSFLNNSVNFCLNSLLYLKYGKKCFIFNNNTIKCNIKHNLIIFYLKIIINK